MMRLPSRGANGKSDVTNLTKSGTESGGGAPRCSIEPLFFSQARIQADTAERARYSDHRRLYLLTYEPTAET